MALMKITFTETVYIFDQMTTSYKFVEIFFKEWNSLAELRTKVLSKMITLYAGDNRLNRIFLTVYCYSNGY